MPDYDFHQLSPRDLEILVRDLLQAHYNVDVQNFKPGKDGGIDLLYYSDGKEVIVQVKHFVRTGFRGLLRQLNKEKEKIRRLNPSRYVLVTSVSLSLDNKQQIVKELGEDILSIKDVLGCEDLNNLLEQHPNIEKNHYKLWISSIAVLDSVLHNASIQRSNFKIQQVAEKITHHVQVNAYNRAVKKLDEHSVVIIAGPPGVGKTTLADMLFFKHYRAGYQPVVIERDINEGIDLFQPGKPQIFYFDDFMGTTFLGDKADYLSGNNDKAIGNLISMVKGHPNHKLILTTREHIFSQAMGLSEKLCNANLGDYSSVLRLQDYSAQEKTRILYNHLYFSKLPIEYIEELLRDNFFLRIIKHRKFNPRLIEWLSSYNRINKTKPEEYRKFIDDMLDDASKIWRHAYDEELSPAAQSLLLTLCSLKNMAETNALETAFEKLHSHRVKTYNFVHKPNNFIYASTELEGSFISFVIQNMKRRIEVIDPSVVDLLNSVVAEAPKNALDIMLGATRFGQVEWVWLFGNSEEGKGILDYMSHNINAVSLSLESFISKEDDNNYTGAEQYADTELEMRLATIIDMAEYFRHPKIKSLIEPMYNTILNKWEKGNMDIYGTVRVIRTLDEAKYIDQQLSAQMSVSMQTSALQHISTLGSTIDEACTVFENVSRTDIQNSIITAWFVLYKNQFFNDDVSSCNSCSECGDMIEKLEYIYEQFNIDVDDLTEEVNEKEEELSYIEGMADDQMTEDYIDERREEDEENRNIADLFSSLIEDRDS